MAANVAHITPNVEVKPSLFEVLAADSLDTTFYPAIRRVADFLATAKPATFGGLIRYYDEIYLVFNGLVQSYYLRNNGGSLAEVFYGLTRVTAGSNSLSIRDGRLSFLALVAAPYVWRKLDGRVLRWKDDYENGKPVGMEKKALFLLLPYLKACYESVKLVNYVMYLGKMSDTHTPMLRLLNLSLTYLSDEEESWSIFDMLSGKVKLATMLSTVLLRGLELSAFFLQFIEWWQNEANIGDLSKLPAPEAPAKDVNSARYANICPICLQKCIIPTVVSISGYVYCYRCIVVHLQKESKCPVTKYPATINDLIRIFVGEDD